MEKLHLGCGAKHIDGYTNIDIMYDKGVDIVADIRSLHNIDDESIDVIYASHVLEHFLRYQTKDALKRWHNILKPGGTIRIAVPDFQSVVERYNKEKNLPELIGLLYGGQNYEYNFHHCCYDFDTLREELESVGFRDVRRYDWRLTDHAHIDDYSQAYLPHMDKKNGVLMSLNVEAIK